MPAARPARGRDFRLLWFGEAVSLIGSATATILLPLLAVLHLHAGPAWMGVLSAATWLPWLVIGLPAGAWVDAWSERRVMVLADLVSAVTMGSVPLFWWLGHLTMPHLLGAAVLTGSASVFFRTAYAKIIPTLVPDVQLESANARLFGTEAVAMVAGPGVAGRMSALVGPAVGLVVAVVGFCVSAVCLRMIRLERDRGPGRTEERRVVGTVESEPLGRRMKEGLAFVLGDRLLCWFTVIGALSNLGLTGYGAMMVLYLVGLGLDESRVGTYFMLGAVGGVLGSVLGTRLARWVGTGRASTLLLLGAPVALLIGLPTTPRHLWLSLLGYGAVGAMVTAGNVIRSSWRQRYVPERLLGRAVTAMACLNYGTMPLAGLLAGWLGTSFGVRPTVLLMAGVHWAAGWLVCLSPLFRMRDLPVSRAR